VNTTQLDNADSWKLASSDTKKAFIAAMSNREYGSDETLQAWRWFQFGYRDGLGRAVQIMQEQLRV
jgi:hypothetical protein